RCGRPALLRPNWRFRSACGRRRQGPHRGARQRISSTGAHPSRLKMRADVGATLPASRTDELILNIGKPEVASPSTRAHLDRVAAFVVGTVDQNTAHAAGAHLSEGDFLRAVGYWHGP